MDYLRRLARLNSLVFFNSLTRFSDTGLLCLSGSLSGKGFLSREGLAQLPLGFSLAMARFHLAVFFGGEARSQSLEFLGIFGSLDLTTMPQNLDRIGITHRQPQPFPSLHPIMAKKDFHCPTFGTGMEMCITQHPGQ